MQLKVIKTGSITEEYLQTKVLATIANAFDLAEQVEQLLTMELPKFLITLN